MLVADEEEGISVGRRQFLEPLVLDRLQRCCFARVLAAPLPPRPWALTDWEDGRLRAEMADVLTDPPTELGRVRIKRPSRRILRLIFPQRLLRGSESLDAYRWSVSASYEGPDCDNYCFDLLPEPGRRAILHRLR